jgi:pimeloyl-ACP methyl ester carboxylesterase
MMSSHRRAATHDEQVERGTSVYDLLTDLVVTRYGLPVGSAPTLLCLHGLTDSGQAWPEAVAHWSGSYTLIAVDQRGHGGSPRFTSEQLAAHPGDVMVDDVIAILEQLDGPPVVVGHSLGGAVALAAGVRRPELVRALVLEDPAPRGPDDPQADRTRGERFVEGVRQSREVTDDDTLLGLRREQCPSWPDSELLASGRSERLVDLDYLAHGDIKPSTPWPELFAEVSIPVLVVSGDPDGDVCVTDEMEQGIGRIANPNVTLTRVKGAEHCIRREQPEQFYAVVDDWLSRR